MSNYLQLMEAAAEYVCEVKPAISSARDAANFVRPLVQNQVQEMGFVLLLDTRHSIIKVENFAIGILDKVMFHAREIFRSAIANSAYAIIIVHNHPSGNPSPSSPDIEVTKKLVQSGDIIGIKVVDHIIVGEKTPENPNDYYSFRENNLLY